MAKYRHLAETVKGVAVSAWIAESTYKALVRQAAREKMTMCAYVRLLICDGVAARMKK